MKIEDFMSIARRLQTETPSLSPRQQAVVLGRALSSLTSAHHHRLVADGVPSAGAYGRFLLTAEEEPCQVVVAVWRPGSQSTIHDHDGAVGAVSALVGTSEEVKYRRVGVVDGAHDLRPGAALRLRPGRATPILPDDAAQLHLMANHGPGWAATVHVYLQAVHEYRVYEPDGAGRYQTRTMRLWFDRTGCQDLWFPPAAAPHDPIEVDLTRALATTKETQ